MAEEDPHTPEPRAEPTADDLAEQLANLTPVEQLVLLQQQHEELAAKHDDLERRYVRMAADYQNFTRRAQQNQAAAREQQLMEVAKALVTVLDHFDRALDVDESAASAKDVLAGVKIVHEELASSLTKFGIDRIDAQPGDAFDPQKHEAMMRQPHDDIETNHVVQQFQPGYAMGDKTIRAAQVSVAQ